MRTTIELTPLIKGLNVYKESELIENDELANCDGIMMFEKYLKKDYGLTSPSSTIDHIEVATYSGVEECLNE